MQIKKRIAAFLHTDKRNRYIIFFSLALILLIAGFLRLYKIREYIVFLGDEGRDVLVVKRMIVDHKLTLLGPITSVGSMYMGPVYYYMMVPFLWLFNFDPVGPAIMVALLSVLTVLIVYKIAAEFINPYVGLIAAFFYATSPLTVTYGKSSWNPNVVPLFSAVLIYALMQTIINKKYTWFPLVGMCLGILIQLHYVTVIFIPIILANLLFIRFDIPRKYFIYSFLGFLATYSPFLLFELRHQFVNTQSVFKFVFEQNADKESFNLMSMYRTALDVLVRVFWRTVVIISAEWTKIFIVFMTIVTFIYSKKREHYDHHTFAALRIVVLWLLIGVASFGLYRGSIYDYYFGSIFVPPFILLGVMLYTLWKSHMLGKIVAVLLFSLLTYAHLSHTHIKNEPNNQLKNTETISRFVFEKTEGKPYNFALIATHNSDHAYKYFLELWGKPPIQIEAPGADPERKSVTDQLFVVCEEKVCQPEGHSLWEIAGFGRAKIVGEWSLITVKIFKLTPYTEPDSIE